MDTKCSKRDYDLMLNSINNISTKEELEEFYIEFNAKLNSYEVKNQQYV